MIDRPTLGARLASHRGPVLLVAPPGSGKTTLLRLWQQAVTHPVAWVSLDDRDDGPAAFWACIGEATRSAVPDCGGAVLSALSAGRGPDVDIDGFVPRLLDEIESLGTRMTLVLDDYQVVQDRACHHSTEQLVRQAPRNLQVAISTRSDPPLALGRLMASGDLLELRGDDLSFTPDEAELFLNRRLGLDLSEGAVAALHARTEGWPAGLGLAAFSLRGAADRESAARRFGATTRAVAAYLCDEVLDAMDPVWRAFLVDTSVLDLLSGPLCDAVVGGSGSADLLAAIDGAGIFVASVDERREWYRCHGLVAELLRAELGHQPDRARELHRRAGAWCAREGPVREAVRHLLAAGETEAAIDVVVARFLEAVNAGDIAAIAGWLELFPRPVVEADARLSVAEAWTMTLLLRPAEAKVALDNALRCAEGDGPMPDGTASLEASALLLRSGFPVVDAGERLAAAHRAFELEGGEDRAATSGWTTVHTMLGFNAFWADDHDLAGPMLERAAALARTAGRPLSEMTARCLRAWLALDAGRVDEAEGWATDAHDLAVSHDLANATAFGGYAGATLGAIRARQGRDGEALALLEGGVAAIRGGVEPMMLAQCLLALVPVHGRLGSPDEARACYEEAAAIVDDAADPGVLRRYLEDVRREIGTAALGLEGSALTDREREVLPLIAAGLTQREVAETLFVSYNTVHSHLRSIYRKLGASTRAEAVARAVELGLVGRGQPGRGLR